MDRVYLNIGCGRQPLAGFVNIDLEPGGDMQHDVTQGLPFPDASVDGIYSEHFFEHITQGQGLAFLRECRRVLKPEGTVRIAMPDLDAVVQRYVSSDWRGDGDMFRMGWHWVDNRCEMLNIAMREWGHQWVYNEEELRLAADRAGLACIGRFPRGESSVDVFSGRETRNSSKLIMEFRRRPALASAQPRVSLLIPAYNPRFFEKSLRSALAQTYPNLEIVICDDCRDGGIGDVVGRHDDSRIRYEFNEEKQGGLGNYLRCLERASGELVKFLNDDDTLAPNCVERMVQVFVSRPDVTLVTSHRQLIDEEDGRIPDFFSTSHLLAEDGVIEGQSLVATVLSLRHNIIGEPTTAMFRLDDIRKIRPHFMSFGGETMVGAGDMGTWLNLLGMGHAAYLHESLSTLRIHKQQRQQETAIQDAGRQSWLRMRFHAARFGMYDEQATPVLRVSPLDGGAWQTLPAPVDPDAPVTHRPQAAPRHDESLARRLHRQLDRHLLWRLKR